MELARAMPRRLQLAGRKGATLSDVNFQKASQWMILANSGRAVEVTSNSKYAVIIMVVAVARDVRVFRVFVVRECGKDLS